MLLFAQPASRICRLTTEHVIDNGHTVQLRLGNNPQTCPHRSMTSSATWCATGTAARLCSLGTNPSGCFPAPTPDGHSNHTASGRRLGRLGIRPCVSRNASLMHIASELPAHVFTRLLGLSQSTADNWDAEASGFSPAYGAEIARRVGDQ
ncbi:hypothetical protein [Streptomyces sp. bgisy084]|uniref:hypothetical protein n=1 Tax=Streptomyces sp. bgisy084 TaxID=3413777 RepID=UPI003D759B4B